jgi:hypothetical protein
MSASNPAPQAAPEADRVYIALYRDKRAIVSAPSSYHAQCKAAAQFKARKRYDVTVYLADEPHAAGRL